MIKEVIALFILVALIGLSAFDVYYVDKMSDELYNMIDSAKTEIDALDIVQYWEGKKWFTSVTIRHSEIDLVSSELYNLARDINSYDSDNAKLRAKARIECIREMEHLTLGSVF